MAHSLAQKLILEMVSLLDPHIPPLPEGTDILEH